MRKQIVNVLDIGADPSGRTDSTEAFKRALADTTACGVIVPAGTYRLSGIISGEAPPVFDPDDVLVRESPLSQVEPKRLLPHDDESAA